MVSKRISRPIITNDMVLTQTPNKIERAPAFASSPIKRVSSYPSPSSEKLLPNSTASQSIKSSKSSPIKKKVMFSNNLISAKSKINNTPKKSILKNVLKPITLSEQDQYLSSPSKNDNMNSPNRAEFWSSGQIVRLPNYNNNLQEELISFKSLIHGGLLVLEPIDSKKQFEVYAAFNLLLKDLNDSKKLSILFTYLNDLSRIIRRDITNLDQFISVLDNDPFKTRIYVQIIKLLTILLSNTKLISNFWKSNNSNLEFFKWIIQNTCCLIMKDSISKSLLVAGLQLLKDQKLISNIPIALQEQILYSILNFKTFNNSASLITEKLNIIKQLITNYPVMMEKNCKHWLPFTFKTLLDSLSNFQLKILQCVASIFLESCSQYLNSKHFNSEISLNLKSDVFEIQNTEESSMPIKESTFSYLTKLLSDTLELEHCELIMLLWISLTLCYFNNSENFNELNENWINVPLKCLYLENPKDDFKNEISSMNAWKSIIYVLSNSDTILYNDIFFIMIDNILKDKRILDESSFNSLLTRSLFGLTNCREANDQTKFNVLKEFLSRVSSISLTSSIILKHIDELISILFQNKSVQNQNRGNNAGNLYLVLQTEPMKPQQIESISPSIIFENHDFFWNLFLNRIWKNSSISSKLKLSSLSGLMGKIRLSMNNKSIMERSEYENELDVILHTYEDFIEDYTSKVDQVNDPISKVEHFNRFTILLKTNFGNKILSNNFKYYEALIESTIKHKVRTTDVLKFIIQQNRTSEYIILQKLFNKFYSEDFENDENSENFKIISFIGNNLESKIFMKNLNEFEINSILNIIRKIPNKSTVLLSNIISMLINNDSKISNDSELLLDELDFNNWSVKNMFNLIYSVDLLKGIPANFKKLLKSSIISRIQKLLQDFNKKFIVSFFKELSELKLVKSTDYTIEIFVSQSEFFYYHLIDSKNNYSNEVFPLLFDSFTNYLLKLIVTSNKRLINLHELDRILGHGLDLCYNLELNSNQSKPSVIGKRRINRILMVYELVLTNLQRINISNWNDLSAINFFIKNKLNISTEGELDRELVNVFKFISKNIKSNEQEIDRLDDVISKVREEVNSSDSEFINSIDDDVEMYEHTQSIEESDDEKETLMIEPILEEEEELENSSDHVTLITQDEFLEKDTLVIENKSSIDEIKVTTTETNEESLNTVNEANSSLSKSTSTKFTEYDHENAETLEIQDSNPLLKKFNNLSSQSIVSSDHEEGYEEDDEEIIFDNSQTKEVNIDVPFSYSALDSSPLRNRKNRTSGRQRSLRESPVTLSSSPIRQGLVQDSIQAVKKRRRDNREQEDDCNRLLGSPSKRSRPPPKKTIFDTVNELTEESVEELSKEEKFEIETRLLNFMLRLRK